MLQEMTPEEIKACKMKVFTLLKQSYKLIMDQPVSKEKMDWLDNFSKLHAECFGVDEELKLIGEDDENNI